MPDLFHIPGLEPDEEITVVMGGGEGRIVCVIPRADFDAKTVLEKNVIYVVKEG